MPRRAIPRPSLRRYTVVLRPLAAEDLEQIARRIGTDSPINAARFVEKILAAIERLSVLPEARGLAPESAAFDRVIRHTIVRPYRVLFTVEGSTVRVLRVYHGARLPLKPDEL